MDIQIVLILTFQLLYISCIKLFFGRTSLGSKLILLQLTTQYLLVEFEVLGVPIRVLSSIFLAVYLLKCHFIFMSLSTLAKFCIYLWFIYLFIVIVSSLANRDMFNSEMLHATQFVSRFGVSTLFFISLIFIPKTKLELMMISGWIAIISISNTLVSWGQAMNYSLALEISNFITPSMSSEKNYPDGIASDSVASGYISICYGCILFQFYYNYIKNRKKIMSVLFFILIFLSMSSAIPNLSRSSLVAVVLICIIGFNLNIYKHSLILRYLYMICYALFFFYVLKTTIDTSVGEGTISTARLQNFESKVRMDALWNSIDAVLNRPFFGGQVEAYKSELYGNAAPHNCFAISAVYNGIPALIVMLLLYSVIICYIIKIIKGKFVTTNYQISFSICLGLLAYLIKGNFHNDTLARGGIMGMILLGILISSEKLGSLTQIDPGQRCGPYPESRSI